MKYQVIIIGGGPAGYTAAESAGKAGLSVLLIEKNNLGGVCLNEGCIPTKTLLYSAKTYDSAKHASKYAINVSEDAFFRNADEVTMLAPDGKKTKLAVADLRALVAQLPQMPEDERLRREKMQEHIKKAREKEKELNERRM